tara:strand:- start:322 stop:633 length:312 start_codon:yes stop_codon:yes gene_type:complete
MTNQAGNTVYEITIWSGGTNHNTQEEDGCPEFFWINEATEALEAYKEQIANGYLDAYVTVRKFTKDPWETQAEYGFDMRDCQPPSKLPKYVQKKVIKLLEATR